MPTSLTAMYRNGMFQVLPACLNVSPVWCRGRVSGWEGCEMKGSDMRLYCLASVAFSFNPPQNTRDGIELIVIVAVNERPRAVSLSFHFFSGLFVGRLWKSSGTVTSH